MTDTDLSTLGETQAAGLQPARLRWAVLPLRRAAWPVLRAWFFHGVQQWARLAAEVAVLRQDLAAERAAREGDTARTDLAHLQQELAAEREATAKLRQQMEALQATLAAFTIERSFFEASVRTELMAVTNVVDCYRDIVEQRLGAAEPIPLAAAPATRRIGSAAG